ncbi:hypothetical protein OG369_42790 [Streptomyces sp. NBC_01221]|uniref:DUF6197 family protein n=1 Tax=Streptomyces sp. NBC_01221 TaxID=2903782 RepID=UPI0022556994|nr:hypothetical protein [Streptomyces sp. NBC_01221]MCX4792506.1 hypothetical protein [Streptomyces sp. NBC_01221]
MTTTLTPDQIDLEAARLYDTAAWQQIVTNWQYTAVEPTPRVAVEAAEAPNPDYTSTGDWRNLLSVPVDQLITDAVRSLPAAPPTERALPGRIGAILPDRLHTWRRIGQADIRPSTHLAYARQVIAEWGWQNSDYRLRNGRGARCVCGGMLTAHRLGYGSADTMNQAGAWILTELRHQGWTGLIGSWNRAPGRTASDALGLIDATIRRASHAGQ